MDMRFKVEGLDGLIGKLNMLGTNTDIIVNESLYQAAQKIQGSAKWYIRNKKVFDTGELFRSISVEKIPKGYAIGTNLEHGVYNEYGTGAKGDPTVPHTQRRYWRYQDKNGQWRTTSGMKARPFLRPAFEKHKKYAFTLTRHRLKEILETKISRG